MTTEEDLSTRREAALAETRRREREHARAVLTGALIGQAGPIPEDRPGHWLFPTDLKVDVTWVLDMCGLLRDEDAGGGVVVMPAFLNQANNRPDRAMPVRDGMR